MRQASSETMKSWRSVGTSEYELRQLLATEIRISTCIVYLSVKTEERSEVGMGWQSRRKFVEFRSFI